MKISNIKDYYLSYNIYSFAGGLVGVFISLFFFSQYSYNAVLYFYLITYVAEVVVYALSSYLLRRYYPEYLYALGVLFSIVILIGLLLFDGSFFNILTFGIIWGASIGVFWAGANILMYDITMRANRMRFVATNNFISGAASLVAPAAAGALIQFSTLPGVYRFLWDFAGACVLFLISIAFILKIRTKNEHRFNFSIGKTFLGAVRGYNKFRLFFVISSAFNLPYSIILPIYLFQVTNSFLSTGLFVSYTVLLSMFANFVFRKGFPYDGLFAKAAIPGIIFSSLLLIPNVLAAPLNVFTFAGLYTVFSTPLNNAVTVEFMRLLDKNKNVDRSLFWANREYYLAIGRAAVMVAIILLASSILKNTLSFVLVFPVLSLYALTYVPILRDGV